MDAEEHEFNSTRRILNRRDAKKTGRHARVTPRHARLVTHFSGVQGPKGKILPGQDNPRRTKDRMPVIVPGAVPVRPYSAAGTPIVLHRRPHLAGM